jgi:hypothetical protein
VKSNQSLFPIFVRKNGSRSKVQVGYINDSGKTIVEPVFDDGTGFHDGLAAVKVGRKWGFLDSGGDLVIKATLPDWGHFREGLASISTGKEYILVNKTGEVVVPRGRFCWIGSFNEGLAKVRITTRTVGRTGFIDRTGNLVIEPVFEDAGCFSEGLAPVLVGGRWGYIERSGRIVIAPRFIGSSGNSDGAGQFADGLAPAGSGQGFGYINKLGEFLSAPEFDEARTYSDGLGLVRTNGKFGYMSTQLELTIKAEFHYARPFVDGLAAVRECATSHYGFIDSTGQYVLRPAFWNALDFTNGLSLVERENKIGYVNVSGDIIWEGELVEYRSLGL